MTQRLQGPRRGWPRLPPDRRCGGSDDIDCVRILLDELDTASLTQLEALLDGGERARAAQFRSETDKKHFIAVRASLKLLLARSRSSLFPQDILVEIGGAGKPFVRGGPELSIAHGGNVALVAFSAYGRVGVDVEPRRSAHVWAGVIDRLHPAERFAIHQSETPDETFLRIWTCKEAAVKSTGVGFSIAPSDWSVLPMRPGLCAPPPRAETGSQWRAEILDPEPDHLGALVSEAPGPLRCWSYRPDIQQVKHPCRI